jgi:hypothetical protein
VGGVLLSKLCEPEAEAASASAESPYYGSSVERRRPVSPWTWSSDITTVDIVSSFFYLFIAAK